MPGSFWITMPSENGLRNCNRIAGSCSARGGAMIYACFSEASTPRTRRRTTALLPSRCKLLEPARLRGAKLAVSRNGRRRRSAEARDWQTWTLAAEAEIGPQAHMVGGPQ